MSTLTSVVTVLGTEDTTFVYTFANLKLKANEDTTTLGFKIAALTSGTLWYGANETSATQITAVTSNYIFSAGGMSVGGAAAVAANLYWKPALNASGVTNGFSIKASASATASTSLSTTNVPVNFDLAAVNDAPVINSVSNMLDAIAGTAKTFLGSDLITHISANDVEGSALSYKIMAISNGTLTVNSATVITPYTIQSSDNFSWTSTTQGTIAGFSIVANDGALDSSAQTVNFVVSTPSNSIPQLAGATPSTTILETQTTTPFSSMIIADADSGQTVSATIVLSAANGILGFTSGTSVAGVTLAGSGTSYTLSGATPANLTTAIKALIFTPTIVAANGAGTKATTFTVTATDSFAYGAGTVTNSQTVVNVTTLNDAPTVTTPPTITTPEDTAKTFAVSDFNYSDPESVALSKIQIFSLPTAGTLKYNNVAVTLNQEILNANLGLLTYTPASNANGANYATFQYKVSDGVSYSSAATATINVTPVNDAPVGVNDTNSAIKTQTMTGNVLTNDTDVDVGATKTVSAVGSTAVSTSAVITGTYGNLTINTDGSYSYLADATKPVIIALKQPSTLVDTFTYTVKDDGALTSTATLTLTVQGSANNIPVTTATAIALFEDANAAATGTLSASDPDGDTLLIKAHSGSVSTFTSDTTITTPLALTGTYGTLTLNSDKTYRYALNTSSVQSLAEGVTTTDTFSYQVNDGKSGYATAPIVVTITGTNDAPTFTTLTNSTVTKEDTTATITFANLITQANEADIDGTVDGFVVKAVSSGTLKIGASDWNASSNNTVDASHIAYWTPAANANGTLNAFTIVAKDNSATESTTTPVQATISVTAVNEAPTLVLDVHELTIATNPSAVALTNSTNQRILVDEVDGQTVTATVDTINGTLSATANGATLSGTGTHSLTVSGSASIVSAALDTLTYTQSGDSDDLLTIHVQDSTSLKAADQSIVLTVGGSDSYQSSGTYSFSADSAITYPTADPLFINSYGANSVVVSKTTSPSTVVLTAHSHTLTLTSHPTVLLGDKVQFSDGSVLKVNTGSSKTSLNGSYNANGDQLVAGSGGDTLRGYDGSDLLIGGISADTFYAGNGNDTIIGNVGNDVIAGGAGTDYFVYHTASSSNEGADVITDFVHGTDKIALTADNIIGSPVAASNTTGFTITSNSGNTYISITGQTTTILLSNVTGVTYSDFVFI